MVIAGIVAGGKGSRMGGGDLPKQFLELALKPVFIYTAEKFLKYADFVVIGMNSDWLEYADVLLKKFFHDTEKIFLVKGGSDRNETVKNIISFAHDNLKCGDSDIILTHDAVRPFVSDEIIRESICRIENCDICTAAVPATDTIVVSADGENAGDFPNRSEMFIVQTPQTFRLGDFENIYNSLSDDEKKIATDVCRLFKSKEKKVMIIKGSPQNIKLTYPYDYKTAQIIAES